MVALGAVPVCVLQQGSADPELFHVLAAALCCLSLVLLDPMLRGAVLLLFHTSINCLAMCPSTYPHLLYPVSS
jgi:hypothetical protein